MKGKITVTVLLSLVVLALAYFNVKAIVRPAKFESVYQDRRQLNENRLTVIKELQQLYKDKYGVWAEDVETLIKFYETDSLISRSSRLVLPAGISDERRKEIEDMTAEAKQDSGFLVTDETHTSIKNLMNIKIEEINKNKTDHFVSMKDFYKIPYTNKKYEIDNVMHVDTFSNDTTYLYQVIVPLDVLMSNFDESLPTGLMYHLFYKGMADMGRNNIKDRRDVRNFYGFKLGDTIKPSTEIDRLWN